ncbi:subunit of Elongator complex,putative [Candida dubliniensis CD36]|uniref:Elongator complex protein 1 n=1 Tax=Candida dubliniensis (strain CD36 / ATCC MYA-646 / CBS 7987 / NCPF 3949 / NRRL Y-17841) TaxID=573826 RepID=B9WGI5_CANDC|nr:subunit of Elongator complex,putative [Candida dubliniensis CD36]CAX42359.1 subunit of Elongator complex,putative [Candida dubliniensis CD36]
MRNLIVLNRGLVSPESRTYPDLHIIDSVFDVISDSITFVLSSEESQIIEVQQFHKTGNISVLASFPVNSKLINFIHFVDATQLIFVFANGDIVTANYNTSTNEIDDTIIEIVGSIDVGISAASWSIDEETLTIVTNENKLLLLSRVFEPICEKLLDSSDIKITDSKHVSVGWGKKETQFKGKGFKALEREREREALKHAGLDDNVTQLRDPTVNEIEKGTLSTFDDQSVQISWRGDCEYFSVSTVEPVIVEDTGEMYERRVIRVFNREGELDSVNEAVDGLEHTLSWKPQGALIASTQRHIDDEDGEQVLDLVFYERNGLRHGQFNTRLNPETEIIQNLTWSSDSEILLFQLQDRVQLWTTKNYHWYLKQELFANDIIFAKFHPEKPLNFMIGTSTGIQIVDLTHKIVTGPTHLGNDSGMTLVTDGSTVKITPLSMANVPPPISFRELDINGNINDLAVSKSNEKYAVLSSEGDIYFSELSLADMKQGKHPKVNHQISRDKYITDSNEVAKQIAFIKDSFVAVAIDSPLGSRIALFEVDDINNPFMNESVNITTKIVLLKSRADFNTVIIELVDNRVVELDSTLDSKEIVKFPQLCRDIEVSFKEDTQQYEAFGISRNGKLFCNENHVVSGVTSLKITESHLLFTTVQSKLCFIHLNSSQENYEIFSNLTNENIIDERIRQVERGSILVNVMPTKYSAVLEAPRGNLETICPRIMVLSAIRKFIKQKNYKDAFITCRTHRIDLDILHDYDPELFFNNVETFITQISKVEYLDLFVSCLHEEDATVTKYRETINDAGITQEEIKRDGDTLQPAFRKKFHHKKEKVFANFNDSKVNRICEAILNVLLKPEYFTKYLQTILTAYACEKPANLTEALTLIGNMDNQEQKETAVTHLCFLQDVNKLYRTCLGLYDVKLTLVIAQQSQMDPKEYLPFLQNLHVQPELQRKFLIDDYLKNYELALKWLHEQGETAHEEFDDYVVLHELYKPALKIYTYDKTRTNTVMGLFAEHLREKKEYGEAGVIFEYLADLENALQCYVMAKKWKQALSLVEKASDLSEKLIETAEKLVESLTDDHKYSDAAEIEYQFLGNVEASIKLYCKQYWYDHAILLAEKSKKPELIESIVDVQINEGFGVIAELLADCKGQMNSQLKRLRELRTKKQEDPFSFYGTPDDLDTPDNVSVAASETSTTPSFFTRYTGKTAGTAKTGASRRTAKNKKREERKRAKGRKGTIYEEEYLIKSVGRLLERLDQTQPDALKLIEGLLRRHMKEQAYQIQKNWCELIDFIKENIDEIHNMSEKDRERIDDNGEIYLIDEIPKPKVPEFPKFNILDY